MTTALIIIGIVAGTFIAFRILNIIAVKRLIQENKEICDAHQKIGYPELEKNVQFRIMETGDYSPISNLIPSLKTKRTPNILLKHYIKISKNDFKEYLSNSNFLERHKIENAPNPKHDGVWIRGNEIIDQERGHIQKTWEISNNKEAIDIYADLLWQKIDY